MASLREIRIKIRSIKSTQQIIVGILLLGSPSMAEQLCFTSEFGQWRPCEFICDLPDRMQIFFNSMGEEGKGGMAYARKIISKSDPNTEVIKSIGPMICDGGMQKSYCGLEGVYVQSSNYSDENIWQGGRFIQEGGVDSKSPRENCRFFPKVIASCVTKRRIVYVVSVEKDVQYESFDFKAKDTSIPSQSVEHGKIIARGGAFLFDFNASRAIHYRLKMSESPEVMTPELLVTENGKSVQKELCQSYVLERSMAASHAVIN